MREDGELACGAGERGAVGLPIEFGVPYRGDDEMKSVGTHSLRITVYGLQNTAFAVNCTLLTVNFFYTSLHIEILLIAAVVFAFENFSECADGVGKRHIGTLHASEGFSDRERLREKALDFASAIYEALVVLRELFDTENRNDVL